MAKKYVDIPATLQVIGGIYNNPSLLDSDDKYFFHESDFTTDFHKILFGSIYNLHMLGANKINISTIEDYLAERPTKLAVYKAHHGAEYLTELREKVSFASFDYYYGRVKKMTLLRGYDDAGMNLSWLYDPDNILDVKKKQAQEDWLDRTSLEEIADIIDAKIQEVRDACVNDVSDAGAHLGEGIFELIERLKQTPDVGIPLYGALINTVTRGARLGKFYLRSAATGVGKSRTMMADACFVSCGKMWVDGDWKELSSNQAAIFISTELDKDELQTMALAFISGVDENHILTNRYDFGEYDRVLEAAHVIKASELHMEYMPNFSLKDIENRIKKNIRDHGCRYIFLDYLHTSMKILEEITRRSGGIKLREDNVLFMMSTVLKDLAGQYGVFILSGTQLNTDYQHSKTPDQNLLRGAKAIADRVDVGTILLDVTESDLESLASILKKDGFEPPDVKLSIYKNRGNGYKGVYLWMKADKACSRYNTIFATGWNYELVHINETVIIVEE